MRALTTAVFGAGTMITGGLVYASGKLQPVSVSSGEFAGGMALIAAGIVLGLVAMLQGARD